MAKLNLIEFRNAATSEVSGALLLPDHSAKRPDLVGVWPIIADARHGETFTYAIVAAFLQRTIFELVELVSK